MPQPLLSLPADPGGIAGTNGFPCPQKNLLYHGVIRIMTRREAKPGPWLATLVRDRLRGLRRELRALAGGTGPDAETVHQCGVRRPLPWLKLAVARALARNAARQRHALQAAFQLYRAAGRFMVAGRFLSPNGASVK